MKRFTASAVLAVAFLAMSAGSVFAAEGLQVGVRAGYNYNLFTITPPKGKTVQSDNGMGGEVSLSVRYVLVPDLFSVVLEPSFGYRTIGSWSYNSTAVDTIEGYWNLADIGHPVWVDDAGEVDVAIKQTYGLSEFRISLPLLFQFAWQDRYYGIIGAQVGVPVATTLDYTFKKTSDDKKVDTSFTTSKALSDMNWKDGWEFMLERSGVDVDLVIGAGYMFAPNFGVDVRYIYSIIEPLKYNAAFKGKAISGDFPTSIMSASIGLSVYF